MTDRFFEDIKLGEIWESDPYEVTEDEIIAYSRLYDPQPMHTDPVAAASGPHGSVIASGLHIAALSLKLFVESGGYGETPVMGLGLDDLRWRRHVHPGDVLVVRREAVELRRSRSNPLNGLVRTLITVTNQHGTVVLTMYGSGLVKARTKG